jgi:hypothetical protein
MADWYSSRCALTWKLKGTKFSRLLFQLHPKTHRTEEIEFGLLPTPTAVQRDHPERVEALKATGATTMMSRLNGENRPNSILDAMNFYGMLPTPTAMDSTNATATMKSSQVKDGSMHSVTLNRYIMNNPLLNTPTCSDKNGGCTRSNPKLQLGSSLVNEMHGVLNRPTGTTSQLNPRFVAEMMGFPPNWTELPFLNGEQNQSKDTVMQ